MADRPSQNEIKNLLETVQSWTIAASKLKYGGLDHIQTTAYNYLLDYVELGDNGINRSHEGERLFSLCEDIIKGYLWDHGWRPKEIKPEMKMK